MADLPKEPVTRQEMYLSRLAGENTTLPIEPVTREEMYLEGAIDRVEAVEQEVQQIKDNPDVVDIVNTYADLQAYDTQHLSNNDIIRVLADETHSGNSTYYRFNKQAGTWTFIGEIASGGVKELTSADYNWPVSDPEGIAYWLLDDGVYYVASGVRFYYGSVSSQWNAAERVFIVETDTSTYKTATSLEPHQINYYRNNKNTGDNSSGYPYTVLTTNSVVQSTGNSTTDVMSQNAVTSMVFADPSTMQKIKIGAGTYANSATNSIEIGRDARAQSSGGIAIGANSMLLNSLSHSSIAIGDSASAYGDYAISIGQGTSSSGTRGIAIGGSANATQNGAIALGYGSSTSSVGEMNIGSSSTSYGYNSTNYRLLSGVHDPVNNHDAATKGYVDGLVGNIESALNAINNGTQS